MSYIFCAYILCIYILCIYIFCAYIYILVGQVTNGLLDTYTAIYEIISLERYPGGSLPPMTLAGNNVYFLIRNHLKFVKFYAQYFTRAAFNQGMNPSHYNDVIMCMMVSHITGVLFVWSTIYSGANQREHQSSPSLAFVGESTGGRCIPLTKAQWRGKCFHLMTSSCVTPQIVKANRLS